MDQPVLEGILVDVEAALRGISRGAGFNFTVRHVERFRRTAPPPEEPLPAISFYNLSEMALEGGPYGFEERVLDLAVEGFLKESAPRTLDTELVLLQHDIYRAVVEDRTRKGLAVDTLYGNWNKGLVRAPDVASVQVRFHIHYRFPLGQPHLGQGGA
jgi:hypothetical protein